jgi:hypothetical protein
VGGEGVGEGEGVGKGKGKQDLPGSLSLLLICQRWLTRWGLHSPAGPVIVSLPTRIIVNLLASSFARSLRR